MTDAANNENIQSPVAYPLKKYDATDEQLRARNTTLQNYFNMGLGKSGAAPAYVNGDWATAFQLLIVQMNRTYNLPVNEFPSLDVGEHPAERVRKFMGTMQKELNEGNEIIEALENWHQDGGSGEHTAMDILTMLGDWFADKVVYIFSEARKFGLPLPSLLDIIMASNFSKLNTDGTPIINAELGKFEKGPDYVQPEPSIAYLLSTFEGNARAAYENHRKRAAAALDEHEHAEKACGDETCQSEGCGVGQEAPADEQGMEEGNLCAPAEEVVSQDAVSPAVEVDTRPSDVN